MNKNGLLTFLVSVIFGVVLILSPISSALAIHDSNFVQDSSIQVSHLYSNDGGLKASLLGQLSLIQKTFERKGMNLNLNEDQVVSQVITAYDKLINTEMFKDINISLSNASLHVELGGQINSDSLKAYFQLLSPQGSEIRTYTWTLNLTTGDLNGPVFTDPSTAYSAMALSSTSYLAQKFNSTKPVYSNFNWAGYQYYDSYVGAPTINPITAFSANVNVVSFGEPPSAQEVTSVYYNGAYYSIYRAGSPWIGLSQGSGGSGGLIQTGYSWSDNGGFLGIWYELFPGPQYLYPDQGTYPIHVGDILSLTLQQVSGAWDFEVYDYNNGHTYTASISSSEDAYYAQTIVEATTFQYSNGQQLIQQIPEFNTQVNFEGANIYGPGPGGYYENIPTTSLYDNGWYTQSYLQQDSNEPNNINNAYIMETGTYYTSTYGYPQETWENSYYNLYGGQNSPPSGGGGGGGGCVLNGTLVSISTNHAIPVQELKVGQNLLSYNTNGGKLVREKVTGINVSHVNSIIDINNGLLYVSGTNDQPIYVSLPGGLHTWIMVGNLTTSDMIFNPLNSTWIPVNSVQVLHGNFTVYDVMGSKIFYENGYLRSNYIADGVLLDKKMP